MNKQSKEKPKEPCPRDVLLKNIKVGFVKSREITKKDTQRNSKAIKDKAWGAGEELINKLGCTFFEVPPKKKYPIISQSNMALMSLYIELVKSFQNAFRLAEEGYYRSAFGELRDILELTMKIKLFYENEDFLKKWIMDPHKIYTTGDMRKLSLFKNSGLNKRINDLSKTFSINRHCSSRTLDSLGQIMTNVCYYRKQIFGKWCKHLIQLKDLGIEIILLKKS